MFLETSFEVYKKMGVKPSIFVARNKQILELVMNEVRLARLLRVPEGQWRHEQEALEIETRSKIGFLLFGGGLSQSLQETADTTASADADAFFAGGADLKHLAVEPLEEAMQATVDKLEAMPGMDKIVQRRKVDVR